MPAVEIVVDSSTEDMTERAGSIESAELSSQASQSETASVSSVDTDPDRALTHRISLINILEISTSKFVSDTDLDTEQEDAMSQALSSYSSSSKYHKSNRSQRMEAAIKQVSNIVWLQYRNWHLYKLAQCKLQTIVWNVWLSCDIIHHEILVDLLPRIMWEERERERCSINLFNLNWQLLRLRVIYPVYHIKHIVFIYRGERTLWRPWDRLPGQSTQRLQVRTPAGSAESRRSERLVKEAHLYTVSRIIKGDHHILHIHLV